MSIDETEKTPAANIQVPEAGHIALDAPWAWLASGWMDLWAHPKISLCYGAIFAGLAAFLTLGLFALEALPLFLALAGGFLLVGPLFAVGLYQVSRLHAKGERPRLRDVVLPPPSQRGQLAFAGLLLMVVFLLWTRAAFLLFMLFIGGSALPPLSEFTQVLLFTPHGLWLLIVGTAVGGILATFVFAVTAFSIPMLIDRRIDVFTAAVASARAVIANPQPMALWAALIVALVATGFATLLLGLVIVFPLIGHATWHAYREVFRQDGS